MVYLLSLAGDRRVLFRLTSTSRLASLGARSWYWRSPGGVSSGGALYGAFPSQPVLSTQLSYSRRSPYVPRSSGLLYSYWNIYPRKSKIFKNINKSLLIEALAPETLDRSTSVMESLWENGSYTGELMLY